MVEVLKNMEEVYSKWERKAVPRLQPLKQQSDKLNLVNDGQRGALPMSRKYQPNGYKSHSKLSESLATFKSNSSAITLPKNDKELYNRKLISYTCQKCAPTSQASLVDEFCKNLGLKNIFLVPQQNRSRSLFVRRFAYLCYVYNCKHFKYKEPSKDIIKSNRVQEGIRMATSQHTDDEIDYLAQAYTRFEQLKSSISSSLLRFASWFLLKVLSRVFRSVQVHQGQLQALHNAQKFSKPVVYVPLHRSHLDYVLITLVLVLNDLKAPLIAAGDNLRLPFFSKILRGLGGFFIKRKLDNSPGKKDYTYRAILHSYVVESLKLNNSLEFFIEGGRSRTGKSCHPKAGLLSVVVDAYTQGDIEDAYVVPVAVSFEKLVEGNFINEQLGQAKKKETFFGALQNIWTACQQNYGHVRVDFGQPFILSEYLESIRKCLPPTPNSTNNSSSALSKMSIVRTASIMSLYGTDVEKEEHRNLVNSIAQHIVFDATQLSCVMSTNCVAFLLLTTHRQGCDFKSLVEDFGKLCDDLMTKKKNVGFSGTNQDVVMYACRLLGERLVDVSPTSCEPDESNQYYIKPIIELPCVLELSYYGAPLVSTYFCQSIVATAISTMLNVDLESIVDCQMELMINREELLESCLILCDIMKFECILTPPCVGLETVLAEVIDDFITLELLSNMSDGCESVDRKRISTMSSFLWDSEETDDLLWGNPTIKVNLNEESVRKICFLRSIMSPFIESYWVTSVQLFKLLQMEMEEKIFLKSAQDDIQKRLDQGLLLYVESIALETIKNCLRLLEVWGVIESHREGNIKLLYLADEFKSSEKISSVISSIQNYRR